MAGDDDLTGIWNGLYTYQDGRTTPFVATLIDCGGAFSGTTHEASTFPPASAGITLYASLDGVRRAAAVTFVKSYEHPDAFHREPIHYEGALNGDRTEIEGRWTIARVISGKFLMIRSGGRTVAVKRKAFQKA